VGKKSKLQNRSTALAKHVQRGFTLLAVAIVMIAGVAWPTSAQIPFLPDFGQMSSSLTQDSDDRVVSACVRLDGRCLFKIADRKSDLSERISNIEQRLNDISSLYFKNSAIEVKIHEEAVGKLQDVYISLGDKTIRLLTVTNQDADIEGGNIGTRAERIVELLGAGLKRAKQERQKEFLFRQGAIAVGLLSVMFLTNSVIGRWGNRLKQLKKQFASDSKSSQPISQRLTQRQRFNVKEVQYRLSQLVQAGIWLGGSLLILSLFPYTRIFQVLIVAAFRIPWRVGVVGFVTYLLIRLSYALIARFNSALASNYLLSSETNQRVQLRITTISVVVRSIVTITWISTGILVALSIAGLNIAPLLAGLGILGVGLSLASQNLLKDVINGFFIILEDQYAVGDAIAVGEVRGLVENMNLRITQLRDGEGRLITIPNSEIKIVANLSSHWSRADLNIPVAYQADLDKVLHLVNEIAEVMSQDLSWQEIILEPPQVLGVEDFGERGLVIRVWIKTQPLKQWEVAREFRRRIKVAFDRAGIPIPLLQQQV
jgi:small-conductance mechanosensitive channel